MAQLLAKAAKTPQTGLKYDLKHNANLWMKMQKGRHLQIYLANQNSHPLTGLFKFGTRLPSLT